MTGPAVSIENLGKRYRITHGAYSYRTLRESIMDLAVAPLRWLRYGSSDSKVEDFWALKDVNLEIWPGEVIGVIGRNGAGKSTLLKVLSRVTKPTSGRVRLDGRVGSLLEVGTGFHPELTGRENIYLNGAILGMSKGEITRKFDEIVEFAEVSQFLDTPVKRYSSGMYVRLAFGVAAHLEPEILIVDEVLAVGDAAFQRKCLGKMGQVAREGRTILFVSHNMGAVLRLCSRCIWLDEGRIRRLGNTQEIVNAYLSTGISDKPERRWSTSDAPGDDSVRLLGVRVCQPAGVPNAAVDITKPFEIVIETEFLKAEPEATIGIQVLTSDGHVVLHTTAIMNSNARVPHPGRWEYLCRLPAYALNAGTYILTVGADVPNTRVIFLRESVLRWTVEALSAEMSRYASSAAWPGVIGPGLAKWSLQPVPDGVHEPADGLVWRNDAAPLVPARAWPVTSVGVGMPLRSQGDPGVAPTALPSANKRDAATKECSLCRAPAPFLFSQKVLYRYDVSYFRCPQCDLIQTEFPYWFEDAPWFQIAPLDTGSVARNLLYARLTLALNYILGVPSGAQCLDYGGGSGLFVRMLRDAGFNFRWHDRFANNIFARGFEGDMDRRYDLVTCFEVLEHLPDAREQLDRLFLHRHNLVFVSTELHEGHQDGWWYYVPDTGGHVSFYSRKTMNWIADTYGYMPICSPTHTLFIRSGTLLTKSQRALLPRILSGSRLRGIVLRMRPEHPSLIEADLLCLRAHLAREKNARNQSSPSVQVQPESADCASHLLCRRDKIILGILAAPIPVVRPLRGGLRWLKGSVRALLHAPNLLFTH